MTTILPVGTWIEYTRSGAPRVGEIVMEQGLLCNRIGPLPADGTTVYRGVWKKPDVFEPRSTYTFTMASYLARRNR